MSNCKVRRISEAIDAPIDRESLHEPDAGECSALWLAVLNRAVLDALGLGGQDADEYGSLRWVMMMDNDFRWVCLMAGVEPEWVIRKFWDQYREVQREFRNSGTVRARNERRVRDLVRFGIQG